MRTAQYTGSPVRPGQINRNIVIAGIPGRRRRKAVIGVPVPHLIIIGKLMAVKLGAVLAVLNDRPEQALLEGSFLILKLVAAYELVLELYLDLA